MANQKGQAFLDKFAEISARVGNQVHLKTLRDSFATIMPLYILAGLIGYCLARNENFGNRLACVVVGISSLVIMMPQSIAANLAAASPLLTDEVTTAEVTGVLSTTNTGTNGLFGAIIVGLIAVTIFIKISVSRSSRSTWATRCRRRSPTRSTS